MFMAKAAHQGVVAGLMPLFWVILEMAAVSLLSCIPIIEAARFIMAWAPGVAFPEVTPEGATDPPLELAP